ncbi:MAG TPA: hypothetical protein VFU16_08315 [Solirubrobacterales bacterium]|nr:hypothetical protein [Solirubrobacterales bacterium]
MREKLNSNPMAQVGVVAVLLVLAAIFLMSKMGGGEETPEGGEVSASVNGVTATGATPGEAVEGAVESLEAGAEPVPAPAPAALPPVKTPENVVRAFESGATVALLFVREGGIDDRIVRDTSAGLSSFPGVSYFVVPADQIARYTSVTGGVGVDRVPALVVLTPKGVEKGVPTASVLYGYQTPASVRQAIVDAGYEGPTLDYHP